jgi:hypothetical protein
MCSLFPEGVDHSLELRDDGGEEVGQQAVIALRIPPRL